MRASWAFSRALAGAGPDPLRAPVGAGPDPLRALVGAGPDPLRALVGAGPDPLRALVGAGPDPLRAPVGYDEARAATYDTWLHHYNHHRPHTGIGGQRPSDRVHNLTGQYS
ncbi:hypothetical protein PSCLAVI8L_90041 [Pseudoclavibacter sp. 8L]|nr:hypothetical protein PSCLAVI8L_90041 [Pseudoclavibacter sp. 8L]